GAGGDHHRTGVLLAPGTRAAGHRVRRAVPSRQDRGGVPAGRRPRARRRRPRAGLLRGPTMAQSEFPLPDVGEGLTEAEIVSWKVAPGDQVRVNQVLVEIETAKSLVELPSPFAGTVTELLAEEGATVEVGAPIIRVDSAGGAIELEAPGDGDTTGEI